ncbi:MAG: DUF3880 domain-containing protein [Lachnospiraceae bacterium]|nr:DUF3880 domain-containing protein [Lachnospiraceae bacterium]
MERIIFYRDGNCNELRVLENLRKLVKEVQVLAQSCGNYDMDAALAEALFKQIHGKRAEAIFSVNYYPILAEVAHVAGIPYLAWIIDSPHYTLYSSTSLYDGSFIFHFDREEAERLAALGRPNVFHQPLASDPEAFAASIRKAGKRKLSDVSFLGRSYQNEHDYFEKRDGLSEYESGFCEALMTVQHELYGASIIQAALSGSLTDALIRACDLRVPGTYDLPRNLVAATVLEKKLSVRERRNMVTIVAERFGITLYSDTEQLVTKGVTYAGYADYETQMASAFYHSRINLNPTLRQIHSGIPLRALDVMASGGFLLSNWQPELAETFTDDEDMAMYSCEEEMLDKIAWYLEHEEERKRIAERGKEMVKRSFGYEDALRRILSEVGS